MCKFAHHRKILRILRGKKCFFLFLLLFRETHLRSGITHPCISLNKRERVIISVVNNYTLVKFARNMWQVLFISKY